MLERLAAAGVDVHVGNRAEHVPADADAVVYSTAIPRTNVELVAAAELGIPVLHRSAALAALAATRRTIAVAGSHGKTTTRVDARADPAQRGLVAELRDRRRGQRGRDATPRSATGEWLVVEADESDGTFLHLAPQAALVTNVEPDHLDLLRRLRRARRARSSSSSTSVDGPVVVLRRRRGRGPARRGRARRCAPTASRPDADYRIVDEVVDDARAAGSRSSSTAARAPRSRCPSG